MPPNAKDMLAASMVGDGLTRTEKETYRPLMEEPVRRLSVYQWLKGKVKDDNIGPNLWRVGNNLYDLSGYLDSHPGGRQWLELTRGTDITEAFHVAHVFLGRAEAALEKYKVGPCPKDVPRRSWFTFEKDGFYLKFKARAAKILKEVGTGPTWQMRLMQDGLLLSFHILFVIAAVQGSLPLLLAAGLVLGMSSASSHNFIHQRDNFRRYYLDFSVFSSTDWRILHFLSHHLFSNTYNDFETQSFFPLLNWNSEEKKHFVHKYLGQVYYQLIFVVAAPLSYVNKVAQILTGDCSPAWLDLMPLAQYLSLLLLSPAWLGPWTCLWYSAAMHSACGYWVAFTTLSATHNHPSCYHAGDHPHPSRDWGVQQVDSLRDVEKSHSLFLVATTFGDHLLHHLAPTVDHSKLHLLYPALEETLSEFGMEYAFEGFWEMMKGMHWQIRKDYSLTYEQRMRLRAGYKKLLEKKDE